MTNDAKPLVVTIDDDPIILSTLLGILKPHYDVRPFASGATALKFLSASTADLILLDCDMPAMSGFDVMERLRGDARTRGVPILFLTVKEEGETEVRALEKGAADYLIKPVKPKVLLTRVRHQLELHRYRHYLESLVEEKTRHLAQAYRQSRLRENATLNLLARATDMRDQNTGGHVWRTTEYVRLIVTELLDHPVEGYTLTSEQANGIVASSKLHDLGKIAIPDHILGKPGKLTEEEFEIVKQHPLHGVRLLDEFVDPSCGDFFLATARDIALHHHERWNGSGYPDGLRGGQIPLCARIVAVADAYDALISERPYKKPLSHHQSCDVIVADSGKYFDPYLVETAGRRAEGFRAVSLGEIDKNGAVPEIWNNL